MMMMLVTTVLVGMLTVVLATWLWMRRDIERVRKRREAMLQILKTERPWDYMSATQSRKSPSDAMHECAKNGDLEGVMKFINEEGFHVDRENRMGETPLMISSRQNYPNISKALIEAKARINYIGGTGLAALHISSTMDHAETSRLLLDARADVNISTRRPDQGSTYDENKKSRGLPMTPLNLAVIYRSSVTFNLLLEYKASPNESSGGKENNNSYSPDNLGHISPTGANPTPESGVACAVRVGWEEALKALILAGGEVEGPSMVLNMYTPLGYSLSRNLDKITKILLDSKANPNTCGYFGEGRERDWFPLHIAIKKGCKGEIVQALMAAGASETAHIKTPSGKSALELAMEAKAVGAAAELDPSAIYAQPC
ncbi:hypothetical protein AAMO2058_000769600 [Amorphochlora amoebiformis]